MGHGVYGSIVAQGLHGDASTAATAHAVMPPRSHWTSFTGEQAATVDAKPPSKDSLPLDIHVIIRKAVGAMTGQVSVGSAQTGTAKPPGGGVAAVKQAVATPGGGNPDPNAANAQPQPGATNPDPNAPQPDPTKATGGANTQPPPTPGQENATPPGGPPQPTPAGMPVPVMPFDLPEAGNHRR